MTPQEHLAAAKANLAPALRKVQRSPESAALLNVIAAVERLEDSVKARAPRAPGKRSK